MQAGSCSIHMRLLFMLLHLHWHGGAWREGGCGDWNRPRWNRQWMIWSWSSWPYFVVFSARFEIQYCLKMKYRETPNYGGSTRTYFRLRTVFQVNQQKKPGFQKAAIASNFAVHFMGGPQLSFVTVPHSKKRNPKHWKSNKLQLLQTLTCVHCVFRGGYAFDDFFWTILK